MMEEPVADQPEQVKLTLVLYYGQTPAMTKTVSLLA